VSERWPTGLFVAQRACPRPRSRAWAAPLAASRGGQSSRRACAHNLVRDKSARLHHRLGLLAHISPCGARRGICAERPRDPHTPHDGWHRAAQRREWWQEKRRWPAVAGARAVLRQAPAVSAGPQRQAAHPPRRQHAAGRRWQGGTGGTSP